MKSWRIRTLNQLKIVNHCDFRKDREACRIGGTTINREFEQCFKIRFGFITGAVGKRTTHNQIAW